MSSLDFLTIRQYAFVVRLDIHHFCSSSLSTNILGIGIKNLFEAYYTNPQQLPDSALKNLYKILKESDYKFNEKNIVKDDETEKSSHNESTTENYNDEKNSNIFTIESDELRAIISDAVSDIRKTDDKRRDILIMRIICDYIAGMTDSFAISEYEKLYG